MAQSSETVSATRASRRQRRAAAEPVPAAGGGRRGRRLLLLDVQSSAIGSASTAGRASALASPTRRASGPARRGRLSRTGSDDGVVLEHDGLVTRPGARPAAASRLDGPRPRRPSSSTGARGQHLDPRRELALDAHAVGLLRRPEPQHVALADGGLPLDPGRVHVEPARRVRVVDDRLVEVRPDPGVDGADAGEIHDQVAVGVGADQDLGDDLVGVVTAAVEGAPEHGERDEAQVRVGHRWILGTSITAGQGILATPPRRRAAARGAP